MANHRRAVRNTAGRKALLLILKDLSQAAVAARIGAKQQYVSAWARGQSRPEPEYREALAREFSIHADGWYSDAERQIAHGDSTPELPSDDEPHARAS